MEYYVYILKCSDDTLYTGITNNFEKRLNTHNKGLGAKYTKTRLPVTAVYKEIVTDKSTALKREAAIKKYTRLKKLALISSDLNVLNNDTNSVHPETTGSSLQKD